MGNSFKRLMNFFKYMNKFNFYSTKSTIRFTETHKSGSCDIFLRNKYFDKSVKLRVP